MSDSNGLPSISSLPFVEALYADWSADPASVEPEWAAYFESLEGGPAKRFARLGPSFTPPGLFDARGQARSVAASARHDVEVADRQNRVDKLIRAYRVRGHLSARIDPLGVARPHHPELDPPFYGLGESDMDRVFSTDLFAQTGQATLRQIIGRLKNTYCRSIGVQFYHIDSLYLRQWLQERMERNENRVELSRAEQLRILTRLTDAVILEEFIQTKYIGAKSFSLEGAESLNPLLDLAIEKAGQQGVVEIVFGMAHRGRLNVLANIMGKSPQQIFREFEDVDPKLYSGKGDVKYHLGYSSDWTTTAGQTIHLSMSFNPSHLEFINPVALGRMRAKQDRRGDADRSLGMVILIHGDAAFAGEGVVQETLNLSELDGYKVGGTLHIVVNNQIGFTTPPWQGCSSTYSTDIAKMLQVPIFHVNGEDPEAVAQAVRLALDFRAEFRRDVVIDMWCYRRRGHNEGDEPAFTQPLLYKTIEKRKSVREGYLDHLLSLGGVTREEADRIVTQRRELLERELSVARSAGYLPQAPIVERVWHGYRGGPEDLVDDVPTGVPRERLSQLLSAQCSPPEDFHPHPKIERFLKLRHEMAEGKRPLDWSAAEALAFATLVTQGTRVRMTGQDVGRGTFSHRHAVLHDFENGKTYMPLAHLAADQAPIEIYNSPLSETGVLGYEYGYSLESPAGLVIWEAQFGDFINAAQVIVDQFISSAEEKWNRLSGVVLLLPHGLEGQGPEHSSARLERFLSVCAQDNIQVVNATTPAQYFHLLRRQVMRRWRKPLVVMSPKSLLRHQACTSTLEELQDSFFHRVLPDKAQDPSGPAERVILCSGKIYFELDKKRQELQRKRVAILRLEQLYPFPDEVLRSELARYADGTPVTWVQEEPENMGAWRFLRSLLGERLFGRLPFNGLCRPPSASPASGSAASHRIDQDELLTKAFGGI